MTILYNCKPEGSSHRITKFDNDLNVESTYLCTESTCECPAGHRHTCRHRQMLPRFLAKPGAERGQWLYDFDRQYWVIASTGEDSHEEPNDLEQTQMMIEDDLNVQQYSAKDDVVRPVSLLELASTSEFNPTSGIPKTSFGKNDSPTYDNATWFSTVQPKTETQPTTKPMRRI